MPIQIRPLKPGEEALWLQIDSSPDGAPDKLAEFKKLFAEEGSKDRRCFLLAFHTTECVGRLHGIFLDVRIYIIRELVIKNGHGFGRVGQVFGTYLLSSFSQDGTQILSWERPEKEPINHVLERAGFEIHKKKIFVEKELRGYRSPYRDPFTYKTLADVGQATFLDVLAESAVGDPFEDGQDRDPKSDFQDLVRYAGDTFDPTWWKIAYLDQEPVGAVLPQAFAHGEGEGTLFYVGVRPEFRGRGFGTILHATGLAFLADHGVTTYKGSTDNRNLPMMRVFQANACGQTGVQLFFKPSQSRK